MLNLPTNLIDAVDPTYGAGKPKETDDTTIAKRNWNHYLRCRDNGHTEYVKRAKKYDDFYNGEQWSEADLTKLAEAGRPALTVNKILSTINTVLGNQRTRRADFQFKPARGATHEGAVALTKLAIAETDGNQFDYLESEVFENGIIEDRGFFDIRMDFDDNALGQVEITAEDNRQVLLDPDDKQYDPTKWRRVIVTRFMTLEKIAAEYGDEKAKAVESIVEHDLHYKKDSIEYEKRGFGETEYAAPVDSDMDRDISRVRVIDHQYYRFVKVFSLVVPDTGELRPLPIGTSRKEAMALSAQYGLPVVSRTEKRVRWTISADKVLLHDDWSIYRSFTIIPYFPIFRPGKPMGLVKNLISPQEQLNKLSSQELHIVNGTANGGWVVEKGSLSNMSTSELGTRGSESGLVIEHNPGKKIPEKIKSNGVPSGIDRISQKAAFNIKEISGVNDSMLGLEGAEVSGVALAQKKDSGLMQLQVPMDNLTRTRIMVGRKLLELFQDYYTEERIIYLTNDGEEGAPTEPFTINQVNEDGSVSNMVTYGRYALAVSTQPARDSYNDSQLAEAVNLRQAGVPIPGYRVVGYSNLAKKHEVAEELRRIEGFAPPSEEEAAVNQFNQELAIKTAIAELQKLQAEINQVQANAMVLQAKAQDLSNADRMELEKLEADLSTKQLEFDLRKQLAVISATTKIDQTQIGTQGHLQRQLLDVATREPKQTAQ